MLILQVYYKPSVPYTIENPENTLYLQNMFTHLYNLLLQIPDKLYPFSLTVNGDKLSGIEAYKARIQTCTEKFGSPFVCKDIFLYREAFHLIGALIVITIAYGIEKILALPLASVVFLGIFVLFITVQEAYIHPHYYHQLWWKGLVDWLMWCAPIGIYLFV